MTSLATLLLLVAPAFAAQDAGLPGAGDPSTFSGVAFAINLESQAEVDAALASAEAAGARILKPAAPTFYGGYAGYFADVDGYAWEIAHNPGFPFAPDGTLALPE